LSDRPPHLPLQILPSQENLKPVAVRRSSKMGGIISQLAFPVPDPEWSRGVLISNPQLLRLETTKKEMIPALHIKTPGSHFTILYSHGNAEDIGISLPYYEVMAQHLKVDVFAYEYVGYSLSALEGAKPSETSCLRSIDAAWRYLVTEAGVDASKIIIFGRSIGSGPAVDLASRKTVKAGARGLDCTRCDRKPFSCPSHSPLHCGGVVLQSPLSSGARAVFSKFISVVGYPFDIFKNYTKVSSIKAQVLIMHGVDDDVVPCQNGRELHALLKRPYEPFWIPNCGHNDIPERESLDYAAKFLAALQAASPPT